MSKARMGLGLLAFSGAMLLSGSASAATFTNAAPITINDYSNPTACSTGPDAGQATPYPSQVQVSGLSGTLTDVNATIAGFSHDYPADVRMLLVGPQGQTTDLMDEAASGNNAVGATLTFDDSAATTVPDPPVTGTFKPTQEASGCGLTPSVDYPGTAPTGPYGVALAAFNGTNPNGTWSLYVVDDSGSDSGSISGGWSLDLTVGTTTSSADPSCKKLRKKLKRQRRHLEDAQSKSKRAQLRANIADTKSRLKKRGC